MPIQNTIARQLLDSSLATAAATGAGIPDGVSPAIRETVQVSAAIAHLAGELYDLPEGAFRQLVLLALAQQATPRPDGSGPQGKPCTACGDQGTPEWSCHYCGNRAYHARERAVSAQLAGGQS